MDQQGQETRFMSHGHSHGLEAGISSARLFWTMCLNVVITAVEIVGGLGSGSLSLLSDALHNLSDGLAIVIRWVARGAQGESAIRRAFKAQMDDW